MDKIDVIIPAYNAHSTLFRCLASIAMQNIVDDIEVTIVDDASDTPYDEAIKPFEGHLKINILRYDENRGPGYARNYGREHTHNPLITFIDADDTFNGTFALHFLRRNLVTDENSHSCFGAFIEEQNDKYLPHVNDTVWVFGKMYKRAFLDKYGIYMNDTRSNEDTGFNALVKMCSNEHEQIKFVTDVVYVWHATENSITRINDCDYSFNASFDGYTDNMIWAIKEAKKKFPFRENINYFIVEVMCNLYFYYVETIARKPIYTEKNLKASQRFYNEVYKSIEQFINDDILAANYNVAARNFYGAGRNNGFIPQMSIQQYLELLQNSAIPMCTPKGVDEE